MTRILKYVSLSAILAVVAIAAEPGGGPPRTRWAPFDKPPVIDGRLDDPCWKQATHIERFRLLENGAEPLERTEALLGHDDTHLFLGFRMQQANVINPQLPLGPQLGSVVMERDGRIQQDDSIEVYINPVDTPEARHIYYRFAANALETQSDAYGLDGAWDAHWEAAAAPGTNCWTLEMAIPLHAFYGSVGRTTPAWRLNLFRSNQAKKEYSAWSPSFARLAQVPERFGIVEAPGAALDRYAYFAVPHVTFHDYDPERRTLQARFAIQNNTDQPRDAVVTLAVAPESGAARSSDRTVSVPARESVTLTAPVDLAGAGRLRADVFVRDPKTRDILAFAPPIRFRAPDFVSVMSGLNYYTWESNAEITVRAQVGESALAGVETAVTLRAGTNVVWRGRAPARPRSSVAVPIANLPAGTYTVEANLMRDGAVMGRASCELVKRPGAANEVKFNAHMGAVVDGRLFFPFGITSVTEPALAEVAAMGFNCVVFDQATPEKISGWEDGKKMAQWRSYLDTAHKHGLKVIPGLYHAGSGFKEHFEALFPKYMAGLPALKGHPALLAWYTVGEPVPSDRAEVVKLHNALKAMDPYHPTFPIFCMSIRFEDGWDIGCMDAYWGTREGRPIYVVRLIDAALRITAVKRAPFWIVPQAGLWSGAERELTPQEQRCQTYLSLVHGVNGIIYFRYKPLFEPLWAEFGKLAGEVKRLTPILLDSETAGAVTVQPVADAACDIRTLYLARDGRFYLLAVNAENRPVTVRFDLPVPARPARVSGFFDNRKISAKDSRFEDRFEGYGTRVYEIRAP